VAGYGLFLAQSFSDAKQAWAHARTLITLLSLHPEATHGFLNVDNLNSFRVLLNVAFARMAVEVNELDVAQVELEQVRPLVSGCIANARLLYHHMVSRVSLRSNLVLEAQHHLDIAREILRVEYRDPGFSLVVLTEYLQVLFAQERWQDAVKFADECKVHFEQHGLIYGEFLRLAALTRMWAERQNPDHSDEPFVSTLKAAMDLAVKHDFRSILRSVPPFASWMCAKALEQGIHAEFVREVIVSRKLPTPVCAPRQWPWAVWLDLIGPFSITLDGQKLALSGKAAQKPLELIKLLACTKRYALSLESAAMQLWPEAESLIASRKNLETTIARARKLIGEAAIKVGEGRVQLDVTLVGCDLQYVLDTCSLAEALASKGGSLAQLNRAARQLSELYEGELLQGDEESLWLVSARQYLRNAYVRATLSVASALQGNDLQTDEVTKLLEIAISREPIAEQLYTKLMQHYADQGRNAEALHTYRRCKQYLSVIAGLVPSKATELIKERLLLS
jgi:DNA-binding SARP family transcriptional activator